MNNWSRHLGNAFFLIVISYFVISKAPAVWKMYQQQGRQFQQQKIFDITGKPIEIPLAQKQVLVFWATWCGPCKVELARINKLVESGLIPAESVVAISIGEEISTVQSHVKNEEYLFTIGLDPDGDLAQAQEISGTPTIMLVDADGVIEWMTMGISPSLELRIRNFLN